MELTSIITLANRTTELCFRAMERSLRAVGCTLPIRVIPYDEQRFELPSNSDWWEEPKLIQWLQARSPYNLLRKYQCLLTSNYHYIDTDVILLENPQTVLQSHSGVITSCGHWHNPAHACTEESKRYFASQTTLWQQRVFNSGQFACDRQLYNFETLTRTIESYPKTCLHPSDQPGMNFLVLKKDIPVTNLTLPPHNLQSSWAGDYPGCFKSYWQPPHRPPYLIHWAGHKMHPSSPISKLFFQYLSKSETERYLSDLRLRQPSFARRSVNALRHLWQAFKSHHTL